MAPHHVLIIVALVVVIVAAIGTVVWLLGRQTSTSGRRPRRDDADPRA